MVDWRARACTVSLISTIGSWTASASAAPIAFEEQRARYMIFRDGDRTVENANWFTREPFYVGYDAVESGFLAAHPDDSQFLVMYTTAPLPEGIGALYQAVANDVHGIGYEHAAPEDAIIPDEGNGYFDDTPNSQVNGFLHMNRWTQYLGSDPGGVDDSLISLVFGQELGHAWLAFVYYQTSNGGPWQTDLLGRANAHWSFYMHTGGSPVQGHDWVDNGDGTFTAIKHPIYRYSDLDLYLMGLLPPEEVEPWFVLDNPSDCLDSALENLACAPPDGFLFAADSYRVRATRRDVTIDDVIAVEGPRIPAFPDAPNNYDISFLLVLGPDDELTETEKLAMDTIVDRSIEIFEEQTRGYASITNRTAVDDGTAGTEGGGSESSSTTGGDGSDPSVGDGDSTASGSGTGGSNPDPNGDSSGGGPGSVGSANDGTPAGCGCRQDPRAPALWLAGLLLPLARRRRRSRHRGCRGLRDRRPRRGVLRQSVTRTIIDGPPLPSPTRPTAVSQG